MEGLITCTISPRRTSVPARIETLAVPVGRLFSLVFIASSGHTYCRMEGRVISRTVPGEAGSFLAGPLHYSPRLASHSHCPPRKNPRVLSGGQVQLEPGCFYWSSNHSKLATHSSEGGCSLPFVSMNSVPFTSGAAKYHRVAGMGRKKVLRQKGIDWVGANR